MIKSGQKLMMRKRYIDVDFGDTNFAEIAKGFGCYGERITDPNEIKPAMQRALDSKLPAVLDVIIDFITPEERPMLMEMYMKKVAGEEIPSNYEVTILGREGRRIITEVNSSLITYEGRPAVMVIIREITEQKQTEKK